MIYVPFTCSDIYLQPTAITARVSVKLLIQVDILSCKRLVLLEIVGEFKAQISPCRTATDVVMLFRSDVKAIYFLISRIQNPQITDSSGWPLICLLLVTLAVISAICILLL